MTPIVVLEARARARAVLYWLGEYDDLVTALAPLWQYALDSGLVDKLGEAPIKAIIETPFEGKSE